MVALPPLAEQHRIVDALEDHLSRLDAGIRILDHADKSSAALKLCHKNAVLRGTYAGADWKEVLFGDLLVGSKGGWSRSRHHLVPAAHGTPYLKMNNITTSGELDLDNVVHVATTPEDRAKYRVHCGDILFNNKNSAELVGKATLADSRVAGWVFNENISRIRLIDSVIPEFAVLQINSPRFRDAIRSMRSASTNVAAIYTRDLKRATFLVPPVDVQKRVTAEHASLCHALDVVEPNLRAARERATALRAALLRRAFSGSLVPQDPTDEPASALLDRIREGWAAQGVKRKSKRVARPRRAAAEAVPPPPPPTTSTLAPTTAVQQELPL